MSNRRFFAEGDNLPNWSNPVSHAVVANGMCFVCGQLSVGVEGHYIQGSLLEEAELAFQNFFAALEAAGFTHDEIVFVDIAFDDLTDVNVVNELYAQLFPEGRRPARTIYQVQALPFGGKVKVMGTAVRTVT